MNNNNILPLWEKPKTPTVEDNLATIAETVLTICCFGGNNKKGPKALTTTIAKMTNQLITIKTMQEKISSTKAMPPAQKNEFNASFNALKQIPAFTKLIDNWDKYFVRAQGQNGSYMNPTALMPLIEYMQALKAGDITHK